MRREKPGWSQSVRLGNEERGTTTSKAPHVPQRHSGRKRRVNRTCGAPTPKLIPHFASGPPAEDQCPFVSRNLNRTYGIPTFALRGLIRPSSASVTPYHFEMASTYQEGDFENVPFEPRSYLE